MAPALLRCSPLSCALFFVVHNFGYFCLLLFMKSCTRQILSSRWFRALEARGVEKGRQQVRGSKLTKSCLAIKKALADIHIFLCVCVCNIACILYRCMYVDIFRSVLCVCVCVLAHCRGCSSVRHASAH